MIILISLVALVFIETNISCLNNCNIFQLDGKKSTNQIINLDGFKNFSQLDFNCLRNFCPMEINFKPYSKCPLDHNLKMSNFGNNPKTKLTLNFFYLSLIDLNNNLNQNLFEFKIVFLNIFHSYFKVTKNHKKNCNQTIISNFNFKTEYHIQFAYSVIYNQNTCPTIFLNIKIIYLNFYGLSDSFIKKNVLGFDPVLNSNSFYYIKIVDYYIYKIKIDKKLLISNLFEKIEEIRFNGIVKEIENDSFKNSNLKRIYFTSQNMPNLIKKDFQWLSSFNQGLTEVIIISKYFNLENYCFFHSIPNSLFYVLVINGFYFDKSCKCEMLIIFKNYFYLFNNSFNFNRAKNAYGTFDKLLNIGCFNQTFIDSCNLNEKLKFCHLNKQIFDTAWQNDIEKSQYIDFISVILSEAFSIFGFISNFVNLIVLKSIIFDKSFKKLNSQYEYKLMFCNSLINFTFSLINIFHLINRCVSLNGIFCSKFYTTITAQYFDIIFVEFLGNVFKLWSEITFITISLIRLNFLKNKLKKYRKKYNIIFVIFMLFTTILNVDKFFILKINHSSINAIDSNEDFEFPSRNTFLYSLIKERKIYFEHLNSLIFYFIFVINFVLNDVIYFILLSFFDLYVLRFILLKLKKKKKVALKLKLSNSKISEIDSIQSRITLSIFGNTASLFFLRAIHLYINTTIFFIKLRPNTKNACFKHNKLCTNYLEASEILIIFSNSINFFTFYFINKNFRTKFEILFIGPIFKLFGFLKFCFRCV